jgi:hypothetical protein
MITNGEIFNHKLSIKNLEQLNVINISKGIAI